MYDGMTQLQCIETTFRMAIKGGIHRLFSESEPIEIGNVFIDGDEQYVGFYKRHFSIDRTLQRFARERRSFVSFVDGPQLIPQNSDHNKELEIGQDPNDSHLLQLCDVLIGASGSTHASVIAAILVTTSAANVRNCCAMNRRTKREWHRADIETVLVFNKHGLSITSGTSLHWSPQLEMCTIFKRCYQGLLPLHAILGWSGKKANSEVLGLPR
jgi:hypothetical protein